MDNNAEKKYTEEQYVEFETAKLLKSKGFEDEYVNSYYDNKGNLKFIQLFGDLCDYNNEEEPTFDAPTQALAMRWLREQHKLLITIGIGEDYEGHFGFMPEIYSLDNPINENGKYYPTVDPDIISNTTPQTYEQAAEDAIRFAAQYLI